MEVFWESGKHYINVRHLYDCYKARTAGASDYSNATVIQYMDSKQQEPEDNGSKYCSYKRYIDSRPPLEHLPQELQALLTSLLEIGLNVIMVSCPISFTI